MKTDNTEIISSTDTLPLDTVPYHVGEVSLLAVQIKQLSGSATYTLQASCDEGVVTAGGAVIGITLWTSLPDSVQLLASGDDLMYDYVNSGYKWVRISVAGTGSAIARINTKG
jgi:hypothetical protein